MSGRVLVVSDGATPHVLPAIRSLSRAGFTIGLGTPVDTPRHGSDSRRVRWSHDVPAVQDGLPAYLDAVARAIQERQYDVVLPGDDADLLALSWGREQLPALLPYASHDVVVRAVDKLELTQLATRAGLAAPDTVHADSAAVAATRVPVVVKARLHWSPDDPGAERHVFAVECDTREEVVRAVADMQSVGGVPLLQQRVDGQLMAVSVVIDQDGRLLAVSQQVSDRLSLRRTSVRAHTTPLDRDLVERVRVLLADLGWYGLANVQFLRDSAGVPHIIDLNGRFYGSLSLAIRSGADLPAVWVSDALGQPAGPIQESRPGVRFHAFEEDLRRARVVREGGMLRDVARSLAAVAGSAHTTWSPEDPRPALGRLRLMLRSAFSRLR
jgi:predicted ATP-grasp superfamily ATP-dependent carboligase